MPLFGRKRKNTFPHCSAVVAAAGSSSRMEGQDKMFSELNGVPVLAHTLMALQACPMIHEIVVVTRSDLIPAVGDLCCDFGIEKATAVVVGGASRTHSVLNGINACSGETEIIAIHDGARPLVTQEILEKAIARGTATGAAAPAVPVKDTIKEAENGIITGTPDRSRLFAVQTPQVFELGLIKGALTRVLGEGISLTDDCAAVERLGMKVSLTEGSYENIKVTTPVDLILAEAILEGRERL